MRSLRCILLAPMLFISMLHAAEPVGYITAKATADVDEASMTEAEKSAALTQQRAFLDAAIAACATDQATAGSTDFSAFVVVVRLDATGRVVETWRQGDSPLALCTQRYALDRILFVPPRTPFHTSFEVSFVR